MTDTPTLNPGSSAALAAGCQCAVLDNRRGLGAYTDVDGRPQFWVNDACPLHGSSASKVSE